MSINGKKAFQLYHDMTGVVSVMTDEQAGKLLKAILTYVNGNEPEFDDPVAMVAFQPIRMQLERDHQSYVNIVTRNRENGRKGGRPKKTQENPVGYLGNPDKPKKADTDKDTDKDNKKDTNVSKKTERATVIPDDWNPVNPDYATDFGITNTELAIVVFRDWGLDSGLKKKDWDRTWQRACREWLPKKVREAEANIPVTPTEPEPQYFEPANRSDILKVFPNRTDLVDTPWSELTPDVQQVITEKCKEL